MISKITCVLVLMAFLLPINYLEASPEFLNPKEALIKLKKGNKRYLSQKTKNYEFRTDSKRLAIEGQAPSVFILSCMDSRSIPEIIFDQTAGKLFVSRVAGNVVDKMILASMEYAAFVGTRLFVIMGHTKCGAIEASCSKGGFGNINALIDKITPAVDNQENLDCSSSVTLHAITKENVVNMVAMVKGNSDFLETKLNNKDIEIVGAIHNIKTGKVTFLQ